MSLGKWHYFDNAKKVGVHQRERTRIDAEISTIRTHFDGRPERRAAFEKLLACVRSRTSLLKPASAAGGAGWVSAVFLLKRLQNLAARQALWLRPCESWRPASPNLRPAFRSLAAQLRSEEHTSELQSTYVISYA